MTIKEIMNIGCDGMNEAQKSAEKERRLKVCEKINKLGGKIESAAGDKKLVRKLNRELAKIKGSESIWLKKAAWFMYA